MPVLTPTGSAPKTMSFSFWWRPEGHNYYSQPSLSGPCLFQAIFEFKVNLLFNNNEMLTSTRFPHHNHLIKENIVHMNLNAIIPSVYIRSISYCMKIPKVSL